MATIDRYTTADLDRLDLPDGWRAEIIDGELYVSKAPSWEHQAVVVSILALLGRWANRQLHLGRVNTGIGVLYADDDNVIPDVVWISRARLDRGLDAAGHLLATGPELAIEVVSPGKENARRDYDLKLALYSRRDALEYWIVDPGARTVHLYGRANLLSPLRLVKIVGDQDWLTSNVLEGFAVRVADLWP